MSPSGREARGRLFVALLAGLASFGAAAGQPGRQTESLELPNGMAVTVAPVPASGVVVLRCRIDAGSLYDGESPGLAALATAFLAMPVLGEPAVRPALTFRLERHPTDFANFRWIDVESTCLRDELPVLLETLARRLDRAAGAAPGDLPEIGLAWLKEKSSAGAARQEAIDAADFWRRGLTRLYPAGSPLASPPWGTAAGRTRVGVHDLVAFLRAHVTPRRTSIVAAGGLALPADLALFRDTLGRVRRGTPIRKRPRLARPQGPRTWTTVEVSRSPGTDDTVVVMWPGDRTRRWDGQAARAIVFLLGQATGAGRLGRSLVESRLATTARASLEEDGAPGFYLVQVTTPRGAGPAALLRIRAVLDHVARGTFDQADLDEWKTFLRVDAGRRENDGEALAQELVDASAHARAVPPERLTLSQLNDSARRLYGRGAPVAFVTSEPG